MQKAKTKVYPSPEERKQDLRKTAIAIINQKLQRMDIEQLREVLKAAYKVTEGRSVKSKQSE